MAVGPASDARVTELERRLERVEALLDRLETALLGTSAALRVPFEFEPIDEFHEATPESRGRGRHPAVHLVLL